MTNENELGNAMDATSEEALGHAMTFDQAIQYGYKDAVEAVNKVNADYTSRLMPDPTVVEFSASCRFSDKAGTEWTITAYYYQDQDELDACDDGDLGSLDWTARKYEVS